MQAMILAAGFGTRLGELGSTTPKCLVEAGGMTLLEHVVERLKTAGAGSIVINLHHLADQIIDFVRARNNFGIKVQFSREDQILGTGGGVRNARGLLKEGKRFFIHNADIYSDFNLKALWTTHESSDAPATLAVMERETSRPLLFTPDLELKGWLGESGRKNVIGDEEGSRKLAFCGIQVASEEIFSFMENEGATFSIITAYMNAARAGKTVRGVVIKEGLWMDVGTQDRLQELRNRLG